MANSGSSYADALGAMAKDAPSNKGPIGSATKAPPPSGVGAMPAAGMDPRTAASAAVMALNNLKPFFPSMNDAIDGWVMQIVAQSKPGLGSQPPMGGPKPSMPAPATSIGGPKPPMMGAPPISPPPVP